MNRRRLATAAVILAVVVPLGALLWFESGLRGREAQRPQVGGPFPALPGLADGDLLPASEGRSRVVVFAKAGCGNCDRTITTLLRLNRDEGERFDLIAVVADSDETAPKAEGIAFTVADPDASLSRRFGVIHVPLVFLVDHRSRIRAVAAGERPETAWRSFLEADDDAL